MAEYFRNNKRKICVLILVFLLSLNFFNISPITIADSKPDLIIKSVDCPLTVKEGETVKIIVKIKNDGSKGIPAGTLIKIALYIDGVITLTKTNSKGLSAGSSYTMNFSWVATNGDEIQRLLRIFVDYQDDIQESNENNNLWDIFIDVTEIDTDLEIIDVVISGDLSVNKTVDIFATVKNNGKKTVETIYLTLSTNKEGTIKTLTKTDGLNKNENYTFHFTWIPKISGSQTISIKVKLDSTTHDEYKKTVFVTIGVVDWWNDNWHYRHFVVIKGSGNVSLNFNFTQFIKDLDIHPQDFENDTIRIVKYNSDGSIASDPVVDTFNFAETTGFDKTNNAKGKLLWRVSGTSSNKYFCIYFDVEKNPGSRTVLSETENMVASGNALLDQSGFVDGWSADIISPADGSYTLINDPINIIVNTFAKVDNVTANIFRSGFTTHNFTCYLNDAGNKVDWRFDNFYFDSQGNWIIRIIGRDAAGFRSIVENEFYVGKPDLKVVNINFYTHSNISSSEFLKEDNVNIKADISSFNANVDDVKVSLLIYDRTSNLLVHSANVTGLQILKNKNKSVSFNWTAGKIGNYNITIKVDPDDAIDESNEMNNKLTKNIVVYGWPDLAVVSIDVPTGSFIEGGHIEFSVTIDNLGEGNATDYTVGLCLESGRGSMSYSNVVSTSLISVAVGKSKQVSLFWNLTKPGEWTVGVKIIVNDTKRDMNILNNQLASIVTLKIGTIEKNAPVISNVAASPVSQEQGGSVTITAKITDDSGLKSVYISIKNPVNKIHTENMLMSSGDIFSYVFSDTLTIGNYSFTIQATDTSIYSNRVNKSGYFVITRDVTLPIVSYFDAEPSVQTPDENVDIVCIATDNTGVEEVEVTIIYPDGKKEIKTMTYSDDGKYFYKNAYDVIGKYTFEIEVLDEADNNFVTETGTFWISKDIGDRDNDGMPDWWEEKYGFNPENPDDSQNDNDDDGYTNLKEYQLGANPAKDIFMQNAANRIKEGSVYLFAVIALFVLAILLSAYGKRRI